MKTLIRVGALIALLAAPAGAQYSVTDTPDSGPGTLRQAVTDSNASPGLNTISWAGAGSWTGPAEGTISLLTTLPAINAGTTFDVTSAVSSVTIAGPGALSLLGATTFDNDSLTQGWMIGAGIHGAGSLAKIGRGTMTLTGANSYGGGTLLQEGVLHIRSASALGSGPLTFDGGTLQTPYSFTIGSSITFKTGNGVFDLQGGTLTLSGLLGGAGKLVLASTGTLFLIASNVYTGGTEAHSGVLDINADAALGAVSGGLLLDGATLQIRADIATSRSVALGRVATFDTHDHDLTLTSPLSGSGGLAKIGGGILALGGVNTYAGDTSVLRGTLRLDVDNALPATTNLTVAAGAKLELLEHAQSVAGFVGAGTTRMTLRPGITNLAVAGNADLTGGTLEVTALDPLVRAGDVFKPLTYASRTGSSQFTIIAPAAISYTPTYNAGDLTLTVGFVPLADVAVNDNQKAVGRVLEPLRADPIGDLAAVFSNLYTLDATRLQAALDQIGPVSLGAMRGMGMTAASVHASSLGRRMTLLADAGERRTSQAYAVSGPSYPGTLSASAPGDVENWARSTGRALASPWSLYVSGVGTTGKLQEANSGSGLQPGYAFNTGGLIGGADYRLGDHLAAGLSAGYLRGHASIYAPASGTVENRSIRYGVYVARFGDGFHANLYLGGASDTFTTRRGIVFGAVSRTATGHSSGNEFNADTSIGYDWRAADWGIFSPFAGLDYDRLMIGSFSETGADALNLSVGEQTAQSLRSTVGLRYSQEFPTDAMLAAPYVTAGWRREHQRQTQPISARLASGISESFSVASGDFARDGAVAGAGLVLNKGREIEVKLDYLGDFRSHYVESAYNVSLRCKF